jgi:hypothetical protein
VKRCEEGFWLQPIFLANGTGNQNSRAGEVSEGQEVLRTAGLETGAKIFGGHGEMQAKQPAI